MRFSLFDQPVPNEFLNDLFQAYFDARKNKRNTINALAFEKNFEKKLFGLAAEIFNYGYQPKPSICFVVNNQLNAKYLPTESMSKKVSQNNIKSCTTLQLIVSLHHETNHYNIWRLF